MNDTPKKSQRGLIIGLSAAAVVAAFAIAAASGSNTSTSSAAQVQSAAVANAVAPLAATSDVQAASLPQASVQEAAPQQETNDLSNDRHYTNTAGHEVHAPAYDTDSDVPAGASTRCDDGTYSFSESHRGTCSHHGGVGQWLR